MFEGDSRVHVCVLFLSSGPDPTGLEVCNSSQQPQALLLTGDFVCQGWDPHCSSVCSHLSPVALLPPLPPTNNGHLPPHPRPLAHAKAHPDRR